MHGYRRFLISLSFAALASVAMQNAIGGWFGYDGYDECVRAERLKRMDRWVGAMNRLDATSAAYDVCEKYKASDPKYQERNKQIGRPSEVLNQFKYEEVIQEVIKKYR